MTKICICFFGVISRSLHLTIESIQKNIFDVLTNANIDFDVYVHNMKVKDFVSMRANDYKKDLEDCCNLLKPDFFSETDQEDFDNNHKEMFNKTMKYGKMLCENAIINAIRQLYSLKQVTTMWKNNKNRSYDYYLYLRPDLTYVNKLNVEQLIENIKFKDVLLSPNWHKWGGLNDRIFMGNEKIVTIFSNRFDELLKMIEKEKIPYLPEVFMGYIAKKYNVKIVEIEFKGCRTRTNGTILDETIENKEKTKYILNQNGMKVQKDFLIL